MTDRPVNLSDRDLVVAVRANLRHQLYQSRNFNIFCNFLPAAIEVGGRKRVFVSMPMRDGCNEPFGEAMFGKNAIRTVYITCTDGSWFQYPDLHQAAEAVRAVVCRFEEVITYGTSMGGYGALLFSSMIGATTILSCSPQYSVDPLKVPFEQRYLGDVPRIRTHGGFAYDDLDQFISRSARLILLFDPLDIYDREHAKLVEKHRPAERLLVPFSGHKSLYALREMGLASAYIREVASGTLDVAEFRRRIRTKRQSSPTYLRFLARKLHSRGMAGVKKIILLAASVGDDKDWDGLRTDVRIASEHGDFLLATRQFLKLVKLDHYTRRYLVVEDVFRWIGVFSSVGAVAEILALVEKELERASDARLIHLSLVLVKLLVHERRLDEAKLRLRHLAPVTGDRTYVIEIAALMDACGDSDGSIALLRTSLENTPNDLKLINLVSDQLYRKGQVSEALVVLQQANTDLSLPSHPHRMRLARLLEAADSFEEAMVQLDIIIAERPGDPLAHRVRGNCRARLGYHESAVESYQRAWHDPHQAIPATVGLVKSLVELGRFEEAHEAIASSLSALPSSDVLQRLKASLQG